VRDDQTFAWAQLLKVLGHPTRLMILGELLKGAKCVNAMSELLDRPQPNVSQHLMALRESGLVGFSRDGVSRCYYLARPDLVRGLFDLLEQEIRRGSEIGRTEAKRRKAARKVKSSAGSGS